MGEILCPYSTVIKLRIDPGIFGNCFRIVRSAVVLRTPRSRSLPGTVLNAEVWLYDFQQTIK